MRLLIMAKNISTNVPIWVKVIAILYYIGQLSH